MLLPMVLPKTTLSGSPSAMRCQEAICLACSQGTAAAPRPTFILMHGWSTSGTHRCTRFTRLNWLQHGRACSCTWPANLAQMLDGLTLLAAMPVYATKMSAPNATRLRTCGRHCRRRYRCFCRFLGTTTAVTAGFTMVWKTLPTGAPFACRTFRRLGYRYCAGHHLAYSPASTIGYHISLCPTLLVHGPKTLYAAHSARLAGLLPNATTSHTTSTSCTAPEHKQALIDTLRAFFTTQLPSA